MKKVIPLLLALCLALSGAAQSISIQGTAVNRSGEQMPGVTVVVVGTTIGKATDSNGNFAFDNLTAGNKLNLSFIGMKSVTVPVNKTQTAL